jgi:hypothetical protein
MNALDGAYNSTVQMTETIKRKWLAQFQELFCENPPCCAVRYAF